MEAENPWLRETSTQAGLAVNRKSRPLAKAAPQRQDMKGKGQPGTSHWSPMDRRWV